MEASEARIDHGPVAALRTARRLDWRFLLPGGHLGRVGTFGDVPADLLHALRAAAVPIVDEGEVDVAVLREPAPDDLRRAHERLAPGGWVYVECGSILARRAAARAMRRLGFECIHAHWQWPAVGAAAAIVPIDDADLMRFAFARSARRRVLAVAAGVAVTLRLGSLLISGASLVGRKPGVGAVADGASLLPALGRDRFLLVTPGFRASRHVIALIFAEGGPAPSRVVKVPRIAEHADGVEREAAALEHLARHAPGSAPELLGFEDLSNRPWLVESAVIGTPVDRRAVRSDPDAAVATVASWLAALPVVPASAAPPALLDHLLWTPLRRLAAVLATGADADLVARTVDLLEPLRDAALPVVFEHGDVSHPNLIRRRDGGLTAIDWELSTPEGLPLHDLAFFLAYVSDCVALPPSRDASVQAYSDELRRPGGRSARVLTEERLRLGLDAAHIGPLLVASWARRVTGALDRLGMLTPGVSPADVAAVLATVREHAFWHHVVADGIAELDTSEPSAG